MKEQEKKETLAGAVFILPSFLGFLVFTFLPVIMSLGLSFTEWNFLKGLDDIHFNGLENYFKLFSDDWFINSFRNNIVFTLVTIPTCLALGLIFATIINKYIMGKRLCFLFRILRVLLRYVLYGRYFCILHMGR